MNDPTFERDLAALHQQAEQTDLDASTLAAYTGHPAQYGPEALWTQQFREGQQHQQQQQLTAGMSASGMAGNNWPCLFWHMWYATVLCEAMMLDEPGCVHALLVSSYHHAPLGTEVIG